MAKSQENQVVTQDQLAAIMAKLQELEAKNKLLEENAKKLPVKERQTVIKINSGGGLYITDPSFKAFSDKKQKNYQQGINIPAFALESFVKLINNESLLKQVRSYCQTANLGEALQA